LREDWRLPWGVDRLEKEIEKPELSVRTAEEIKRAG
jgi:hypothetical protein